MALVLTFAGCVLVAGLIGSSYTLTPKVILLGLSSGLFYGLYSIFGSVALRTYDTRTVTAYTFLFATLGTLPICGVGAMRNRWLPTRSVFSGAWASPWSVPWPLICSTPGD